MTWQSLGDRHSPLFPPHHPPQKKKLKRKTPPNLACKQMRAFSSHRSDTVRSSWRWAMAVSNAGCGASPTPDSISFLITSSVTDWGSFSVEYISSSQRACCRTCKSEIFICRSLLPLLIHSLGKILNTEKLLHDLTCFSRGISGRSTSNVMPMSMSFSSCLESGTSALRASWASSWNATTLSSSSCKVYIQLSHIQCSCNQFSSRNSCKNIRSLFLHMTQKVWPCHYIIQSV